MSQNDKINLHDQTKKLVDTVEHMLKALSTLQIRQEMINSGNAKEGLIDFEAIKEHFTQLAVATKAELIKYRLAEANFSKQIGEDINGFEAECRDKGGKIFFEMLKAAKPNSLQIVTEKELYIDVPKHQIKWKL